MKLTGIVIDFIILLVDSFTKDFSEFAYNSNLIDFGFVVGHPEFEGEGFGEGEFFKGIFGIHRIIIIRILR